MVLPMVRELREQQGFFRLVISQSSLGPSATLMAGPTLWEWPTLALPGPSLLQRWLCVACAGGLTEVCHQGRHWLPLLPHSVVVSQRVSSLAAGTG